MGTRATVLDADYIVEDGPVSRIFCVSEDGDPVIVRHSGFYPYFYAVPEDIADARSTIEDGVEVEGEEFKPRTVEEAAMVDGREEITVLKVYASEPPEIPKLRKAVKELDAVAETREFDIPFYKRYLIDNGISPGADIRISSEDVADGMAVDVEQAPEPLEGTTADLSYLAFDLEVHGDEIIMCSFYGPDVEKVLVKDVDGFGTEFVETVADEAALLEEIVRTVKERDPDVLLGYNTDEFDFDILRERSEELGVELEMGRTDQAMTFKRRGRFSGAYLEGRAHIDLYAFVENVVSMGMKSDVLTLDSVAEELLGENKDDVSWDEMKRYWEEKEELDVFAEYALRDSELAYRLGESLVPQILSLSRITGLPPFDVCRHTYGQLVENYLLRNAHQRGILAPNRPGQEERSRRYSQGSYTGGFVYEPEEGLHENIALFDFRSLYPTIMVSHNISPEMLEVEGCEDELEVDIEESSEVFRFCQDETGFIASLVEGLVVERYELKEAMAGLEEGSQEYRDADNRQRALKILSNAFYGYMGYNGARWYSRPCAEATTALGREYIQETIERAEEMGCEVVYGDTDSVMVKGGNIEERLTAFQEEVNAELPEFMELEFEGFFPRGLFTYTEGGGGAKKKYALIDREGNVKITGFEQVRRDWSGVAKDVQEEVIRKVLEGDVDGAVEAVKSTVQELKEGDVSLERLKIYTSMNKKPENYEAKTPHSEAAKRAIKRGEDIAPGDTIAYVVTEGSGSISDRAEILKYADTYDAAYYIEKQVIPVALRVLKVLGYTKEELLGKGRQSGLERFG